MDEMNDVSSIYKAGKFIGKNPCVIKLYDGKDWMAEYNITIR